MQQEKLTMLRHNLSYHLRQRQQQLAQQKLQQDDFITAFDKLEKVLLDGQEIPDTVWGVVLSGLASAAKGK